MNVRKLPVARMALSIVLLTLGSSTTHSIIMRHDLQEQRFLDLATHYPPTASVRPSDPSKGLGGEGTLIAPKWVLTAAHVAAELVTDDIVEVEGQILRIDHVIIHPEWHREIDVQRDVALVGLKSPVNGVQPALLYTKTDELGMLVTFVGRGGTGTGLTGPTGSEDRRLRAVTNRVEKAENPFLQFRFDAPTDPNVTDLEGISGPGDSGGPAYITRDGKLYIIGVSSYQDSKPTNRQQGRYGVLEYYCRVSYFAKWITGIAGANKSQN